MYRPINIVSSRLTLHFSFCCIAIHIRFQFVASWLCLTLRMRLKKINFPWLSRDFLKFPDFFQNSKIPWPRTKFPDFSVTLNFPDFSLTAGNPELGYEPWAKVLPYWENAWVRTLLYYEGARKDQQMLRFTPYRLVQRFVHQIWEWVWSQGCLAECLKQNRSIFVGRIYNYFYWDILYVWEGHRYIFWWRAIWASVVCIFIVHHKTHVYIYLGILFLGSPYYSFFFFQV